MKCSYISYLLFWVIIQQGETLFHHSTRSCYSNTVVHLWRNIKKCLQTSEQFRFYGFDNVSISYVLLSDLVLLMSQAQSWCCCFLQEFMNLVTLVEILLLFTIFRGVPQRWQWFSATIIFFIRSDQNQDAGMRIKTAKSPPFFFFFILVPEDGKSSILNHHVCFHWASLTPEILKNTLLVS